SNSMSFGRPYIMRTTGCIHDGWLVLRDKSGLFDQSYLYYFLSSSLAYGQFDRLAAGSTVRNLNTQLVSRVQVVLPPLSDQRRIVGILDQAFEAIAMVRARAEKNRANARQIFTQFLHDTVDKHRDTVSLSALATDVTDGDHSPPPKASSGIPF